jgi:hypothetical protein
MVDLQKAGARLWNTGRLTEAEVAQYVSRHGLVGRDAENVFAGYREAKSQPAPRGIARPVFGRRGR